VNSCLFVPKRNNEGDLFPLPPSLSLSLCAGMGVCTVVLLRGPCVCVCARARACVRLRMCLCMYACACVWVFVCFLYVHVCEILKGYARDILWIYINNRCVCVCVCVCVHVCVSTGSRWGRAQGFRYHELSYVYIVCRTNTHLIYVNIFSICLYTHICIQYSHMWDTYRYILCVYAYTH
jgi:hypothetical protein